MSAVEQLHKGMVIRHEGQLFTVLDFRTVQSGKQKPTVHVKLRSLRSGNTGERTLDELGTLDLVPAEVREMQFLYAGGTQWVFMDCASFEQFELEQGLLGDAVDYLVEEQTYRFLTVEGQPVSIQLPDTIALEVTDTAPPEHGGGSSSVYKEATVASGAVIKVPLFVKTGDRIRVSTTNRGYLGKEH